MKSHCLVWTLCALLLSACSTPALHTDRKGLFDVLAEGATYERDGSGAPAVVASETITDENADRPFRKKVSVDATDLQTVSLRWPLTRVLVTSPFGDRGSSVHDGVDLKANKGTPIYAAGEGKVLYAGSKISGYGQMIVIRHGAKLSTVYAHASKLLVKKGQRVKQGQLIAMSGKTGRASGPHLHFEVRKGSDPVDPSLLIPRTKLARANATRKPAQSRTTRQL